MQYCKCARTACTQAIGENGAAEAVAKSLPEPGRLAAHAAGEAQVSAPGRNYMGHSYAGHSYVGYHHVSRSYVGRNYEAMTILAIAM